MKNKWNKPYQIIKIVISIITGIMGLAFLIQTLRIYIAHQDPVYSRATVGSYLMQILAVLIIWILAVLAGVVLAYLDGRKEKILVKTTNYVKLKNLISMLPDDSKNVVYQKERKKTTIVWFIIFGILLICLVMSCLYLFNPKHFIYDGNPTAQIRNMALHLLPWVVISGGALIGMVFYLEWNAKNCIPLVKQLLSVNGKQEKKTATIDKRKLWALWITRGALLICAITLIIVGALTGGADGVLQKAINICTECIGLG